MTRCESALMKMEYWYPGGWRLELTVVVLNPPKAPRTEILSAQHPDLSAALMMLSHAVATLPTTDGPRWPK